MNSSRRLFVKVTLGIFFLSIFIFDNINAQSCPSFKIKEIINTNSENQEGSVIVDINSSKLYTQENFQIRQKDQQVTGQLDFQFNLEVSRNELIISGLKKSEELYLKDYIILFSDKGCKNSQIIEVGTFKIK